MKQDELSARLNNFNMTEEQKKLWSKIQNFEIDDGESSFSFVDRLARENNWTIEFSLRAIEEYKKFIFLVCTVNHPLTPSDEVDQVWHLHLIYTQSYWIEMCKKTLAKDIHHGPTKGGVKEKDKFRDWYAETKKKYKELFKEAPPKDIWPSSKIRFNEIYFTRINRHRNWVIPKIRIF